MATYQAGMSHDLPHVDTRSVFALGHRWITLLLLGIVQVIGGAVALSMPGIATLAATIVFGAVLIVSGVFQGALAFSIDNWKGRALQLLGALLYIGVGVFILGFPLSGALTLALLIGALLAADGVARMVLAYRLKPARGWGWLMAGGVASTALGILLLAGWPATGLWSLGVLLGVSLLFSGASNCAWAIDLRTRRARHAEA